MSPTPLLLPMAVYRPVSYHLAAPKFNTPAIGLCLHVQEGTGSPWRHFSELHAPDRAFSHFWIGKLGHTEQYQTTDREGWAQGAGNALYWSVETEGHTTEPLTLAQVKALAQLVVSLGISKVVADIPGGRGLITHGAGGRAWGNHPGCPGVLRKAQRPAILSTAGGVRPPVHPPTVPAYPGLMTVGSHGSHVTEAQRRFQARGWRITADGIYGTATAAVVRSFQAEKHLAVDGMIGSVTWQSMWTAPL